MREAHRLKLLRATAADLYLQEARDKRVSLDAIQKDPGSFSQKLLQAGIEIPVAAYIALVFGVASALAVAFLSMGSLLSLFLFGLTLLYGILWFPEERALKRRNLYVPQLPTFVDGLATALATGYNIEAAVKQSTQGLPEGLLRKELERVTTALERGLNLAESFSLMKYHLYGQEIVALASAIILFRDLGGRMIEPFRQLAKKVREQQAIIERAQRDLVQIKQAFTILLFLSVVVPFAVIASTPSYLALALHDPLGQLIIQIAIMCEVSALFAFRRMIAIKI
jgi:Flp pilus assembly protein TadB